MQFHVIFMLGVPCAGKGTLCSMLTKSFDQIGFISAGDCLREARNDKNNQYCDVINTHINEGTIVPGFITTALLHLKMNNMHEQTGLDKFIIDGFPRTFDNLKSFLQEFGLIPHENENLTIKNEKNFINENIKKISKSKA